MAMMGYREYARHRGCALQAVQKAIKAGRIHTVRVNDREMIDSEQADRSWVDNTDPMRRDPGQLEQATPARSAPPMQMPLAEQPATRVAAPAPAPADKSGDDDEPNEFREQRVRQIRAQAENAELDLAIRKGNLVDVALEEQLIETCERIKRDRDNMIGSRLAPQLISHIRAGGDDIAALTFSVEQLINAEVRAAHEDAIVQIKALKLDDDAPD